MAQTVSPITRDGHEYRWTHYAVEMDNGEPYVSATRYRTDGGGHGVWVWKATGAVWQDQDGHVTQREYRWAQVVGWSQFDLNVSASARRERVLAWLDFADIDGYGRTSRQVYAATPRIPRADLPG